MERRRLQGEIDLPSRGLLYDPKKIPVRDGKLECYLITAREEKIFAGAKGDLSKLIDAMLSSLIIRPEGFLLDTSELLSSDRMYIMFILRALSYGNDYGFQVVCPACEHQFRYSVQIPQDFEVKTMPTDAKEPFEVTLPMTGYKLYFRLMRGYDERITVEYSNYLAKRSRGVNIMDGDPTYNFRMALLLTGIESPDGDLEDVTTGKQAGITEEFLTKINNKINFIETTLVGKDSATYRKAIVERDSGINLVKSIQCPNPSCNHIMINESIGITEEFFRPEY